MKIAGLAALLVLLSCASLSAGSLNRFGIEDEQRVQFDQPTMVGDTFLPAGSYKMIHAMQGQNHIMLFRRIDNGTKPQPIALSKCTLKPLNTPATSTVIGFRYQHGVRLLTYLQFKGETAQHVFE